jgi:hypothetical protein
MPRETRTIEPADIIDIKAYGEQRKALRLGQIEAKKKRRLSVGPYVTVFFESYDSMWLQVQEMLYIERGGEAQVADELAAYNPMIPNGRELTATLMFEIDDPKLRASILGRLGGIENHIYLHVGETRISAVPEGDVERSRADGKASSVHFLHFPFRDDQIADWKGGHGTVIFGIDHPGYGHMAIIGPEMRAELARDFA